MAARGWRVRRATPEWTDWPPVSARARPSDYADEFHRGAIEHDTRAVKPWRNYSFHTVVIPDGTTLRACNYSQFLPVTLAIQGLNLHFIQCNLVNVQVHASWVLEGCNTAQVYFTEDADGNRETVWLCRHPSLFDARTMPPPAALARARV